MNLERELSELIVSFTVDAAVGYKDDYQSFPRFSMRDDYDNPMKATQGAYATKSRRRIQAGPQP